MEENAPSTFHETGKTKRKESREKRLKGYGKRRRRHNLQAGQQPKKMT
jgi:hypothetical protein